MNILTWHYCAVESRLKEIHSVDSSREACSDQVHTMTVGRTAKRVEYQMKQKEGLLEGSEGSSSAVSQEKLLARVSPQGTCWIKVASRMNGDHCS